MRSYSLTDNGAGLIQRREGCRLRVYRCSAGKPTIGYGATRGLDGRPLTMNTPAITQAEADYLFNRDKVRYEQGVNRVLQVDVPSGAFDALVSLTYNIGRQAFARSSCLRYLNAGDVTGAARALTLWNKVTRGGRKVVSRGLKNRRQAEKTQFLDAYAVPQINDVPDLEREAKMPEKDFSLAPKSSTAHALGATRAVKYDDLQFLSESQLLEFVDSPISLIANCFDKKAIGEMQSATIKYEYEEQLPTDPTLPEITGQKLSVVFNGKYHPELTGERMTTKAVEYHPENLVKQVRAQYRMAEAILRAYYKRVR